MAKVSNIGTRNVPFEEALQEFLLMRKAGGVSKTTLSDDDYHITKFIERAGTWCNVPKAAIEYMTQDMSNNYFNLRLKSLKLFFAFCVDEEYMESNPLQEWKQRRVESRIVNIDEDVLKELLKLPNQKTFAGLRDYALILLQLDTGIRPKEAMSLTKGDMCFKQLLVNVQSCFAKTRVSRSLPISLVTAKAIKKLLDNHHESWRTNLVFCTHEGAPMNRRTWSNRMLKYSKKLHTSVKPYDLRHCFALQFLRAGGNIFALQRMMGHANLSMTSKYLALCNEDIRAQHTQNSPLNALTSAKRVSKSK